MTIDFYVVAALANLNHPVNVGTVKKTPKLNSTQEGSDCFTTVEIYIFFLHSPPGILMWSIMRR